jgi:predicted nucleic acid-binding protein
MSPVVQLELLHSARTRAEFEAWHERLGQFRSVPLTNSACVAAIQAISDLASRGSDGYHRVGLGDALVAASAQDVNPAVGVLHYNHRHFDRLAEVLAFDSVPLGAPGTFEPPAT